MPMFTSIILSALFTFAFLLCITLFAFRNQLTNTITLADMKYCERQIRNKYRTYTEDTREINSTKNVDALNIDKLAKCLSLQMEVVAESSLPEGVRAYLDAAPKSSGCNGVVRYACNGENDYESNFDLIHEIMHYLNDVGAGKQVTKSFARLYHGNRRGYHEQVIDYYAAAVAIPKESLQERIRIFNGNPYDDCFVSQLSDVYKQPKETIIRRIGEVMALS